MGASPGSGVVAGVAVSAGTGRAVSLGLAVVSVVSHDSEVVSCGFGRAVSVSMGSAGFTPGRGGVPAVVIWESVCGDWCQ